MAKKIHPALGRFKAMRVVFLKNLDLQSYYLSGMAAAQGATIQKEVNALTTHLVSDQVQLTATLQKKINGFRKTGATIEILSSNDFLTLVRPTEEEIVALMKDKKNGAKALAEVVPYLYSSSTHGPPANGTQITCVKFDKFELSNCRLANVEFYKCSFVGAKLEETAFEIAKDCDFSQAVGKSAHFAEVGSSRFTKAQLQESSFSESLDGCDFTAAQLDGTRFDGYGSKPAGKEHTNFAKASLRKCDFSGAELQGANFAGADLTGASFDDCKLAGASFRQANLQEAIFVNNDLSKADFTHASLAGANFAEANLTAAKWKGADITGANFRGAKVQESDLRGLKGYSREMVKGGAIGKAIKEIDALAKKAKKIEFTFRVARQPDDQGIELRGTIYGGPNSWSRVHSSDYDDRIQGKHLGVVPFSKSIQQAGSLYGHLPVRFETVLVKTTKSPMGSKELQQLIMEAIGEAFGQEVPTDVDSSAAAQAFKAKKKQAAATRAAAAKKSKAAADKRKEKAKKEIAQKIEKEVGQVTDVASFLKALELRIEKPKIDKATKMLKASSFKLFNDVTAEHMSGVVKSQTDADLVYACRLASDGNYSCATQNLNICGGLRGSICKHLLVLIIGLVQAGELDPTSINEWVANTQNVKPELDRDNLGEIFLKYKGAEAGEIDWRPTETLPEDYYAY